MVLAYALSPIDLIPDFIPVLGYVDDVLLLPGRIWLPIKLLPPSSLSSAVEPLTIGSRRKDQSPTAGSALFQLCFSGQP